MKGITLYRRDFVNHSDNGESMFNDVLSSLKISADDWDDIDEIDIFVDSFKIA